MNKKGFTLVELLVTIVILAIIMLIAVPNIMNTIERNRQDTYIETAKRMITLAEYEYRSDTSIPEPEEDECVIFFLRMLDLDDENGPNGGTYDKDYSYVVMTKENDIFTYYATLFEAKEDNGTTSRTGVNLVSESELNEEGAGSKYVQSISALDQYYFYGYGNATYHFNGSSSTPTSTITLNGKDYHIAKMLY